MSPAADVLYTAVVFTDEDGGERYGYALVPRTAAGVTSTTSFRQVVRR